MSGHSVGPLDHDADPLARVTKELAALDEAPVETHADGLEAVHRTMVAELDRLAGIGSADDRRVPGDDA